MKIACKILHSLELTSELIMMLIGGSTLNEFHIQKRGEIPSMLEALTNCGCDVDGGA